ncbi:MAG TPA: helix-turn-helix transcriptional regulator [Streptosporangiaceae bacterium]|nr:helix-turn-helix transcriptional regulator [Streptosporangiaceae bacterium]
MLGLVARGLSGTQVAERLVISPHTVHRHVANILAKLGLPTRAAAAADGPNGARGPRAPLDGACASQAPIEIGAGATNTR